MNARDWTLLLILAALWGGTFFFIAVVVDDLPTLTIVAARVSLAAVTLGVFAAVVGLRLPRDAATWRDFVVLGVLNNALPFGLNVWSQAHLASGLAAVFNATTPLFTVLVAHVATRDERLGAGKIAGVLIGLAGVAVLIGTDALRDVGIAVVAQIALLGAALSYACGIIYARRLRHLPATMIGLGQLCASSAMMVPLALLIDRPWLLPVPGGTVIASVVSLAVFSTALAYVLYFSILTSAGATNASLVTFLNPVSAILLGSFVLGERLAPHHFAGMALIFAGLTAIDGRLFRRLRRAPA